MQSDRLQAPEGITTECKSILASFVAEWACPRVERGWLISLLASPPVVVAATACGQGAAADATLLRACLPVGLVVSGCWQLDDGSGSIIACSKMWKESGCAGEGAHVGVTAAGELVAALPIVSCPHSRLLNISFSFAVAEAVAAGGVAAFLLNHSCELLPPGSLLVSDLSIPKDATPNSPFNLTLTCRVTVPSDHPKPSPVLLSSKATSRHGAQQLHTVCAHVPPAMPLSQLLQLLLSQVAAASEIVPVLRHEFLQFKMPGWVFRVNVCVPEAASDAASVEGDDDEEVVVVKPQDDKEKHWLPQRLQLHALFGLPLSRPVFRTILSINETAAAGANGKLVNVHAALVPPSIPGAKVCLVYGKYEYYHYLQDRENDKGWGCAYRSLQSVWSWFRLQGYTSRPPPSILEIQKCVVATGFRPKTLIGTKDWIGSVEVGAVLDQELQGCSHKIMNLSSGHELDSHARDLVSHFSRVGTPITTGGGELAHTMLGICANLDTGETRYLILDPHYTGADDEKSVVKGKGCQWVSKDFFDKTSFLNLCLPQPPQEQ